MTAEVQSTRSFGEWYLDSSIPGHAPLVPSIFLGKVCTWIVSPIDENGCEAVVEVISRIIVILILPIIALVALILTPFGLLSKSIGGGCSRQSPPTLPVILNDPLPPVVEPKKPVKKVKKGLSGRTRVAKQTQKPQEISPYSAEVLRLIPKAAEALERINTLITPFIEKKQKLDINILNEADSILQTDKAIKQLWQISPEENPKKDDPIENIREAFNLTKKKIKSLKFRFDFPPLIIEEGREKKISDNGDCLFAASCWLAEINGSQVTNDFQERQNAMDYIESNYERDDPVLKRHLLNSMSQHYATKSAKLEEEERSKTRMLEDGTIHDPLQRAQAQQRLKSLPREIKDIEDLTITLCDAFDDFSIAAPLVPDYIKEMRLPNIHGGAAELYALSCIHKVCILVHNKNGKIDQEPDPSKTMNPHFKGKTSRRFIFSGNHYNAYDER